MDTPRRAGGQRVTSSPPMEMRPAVGRSSPAMVRSSVLLPQPEGPTNTMNSPWRTCIEMSLSTPRSPNDLCSRSISTSAIASSPACRNGCR